VIGTAPDRAHLFLVVVLIWYMIQLVDAMRVKELSEWMHACGTQDQSKADLHTVTREGRFHTRIIIHTCVR
jgi:cytochrome c biogenesis protein ResB